MNSKEIRKSFIKPFLYSFVQVSWSNATWTLCPDLLHDGVLYATHKHAHSDTKCLWSAGCM